MSFSILMQLFTLLSDLITFKIHTLSLGEIRRAVDNAFFSADSKEKRHKITKVYAEKLYDIQYFENIRLLFPGIIYSKVNLFNDVDIHWFVRTILKKINHGVNYYLRSLCFHSPSADDQMIEKLDKMIRPEKFLCDYTMKRVCMNIYLQ